MSGRYLLLAQVVEDRLREHRDHLRVVPVLPVEAVELGGLLGLHRQAELRAQVFERLEVHHVLAEHVGRLLAHVHGVRPLQECLVADAVRLVLQGDARAGVVVGGNVLLVEAVEVVELLAVLADRRLRRSCFRGRPLMVIMKSTAGRFVLKIYPLKTGD